MGAMARPARIAARLGAGGLAWRWRHARGLGGRAHVLMYHRVADEPDYLGLSVAPAIFARQLVALRRRATVVPLGDLVARLADGAPLDRDLAAVTFDDGYRDNLDVALPILRREGVPATVFVTTGFVDGTAYPAGERLRQAARALRERRIPPAAWSGTAPEDAAVRAALAVPAAPARLAALRRALKRLPDGGEVILARLEAMGGGPAHTQAMLDWDGVRSLADAGIEIGSHGVTHALLSRLTPERAEAEIRDSKARLEDATGRPVHGFAFPNGKAGDFLPVHFTTLRAAGYAYACLATTGPNRPGCDPFRLRRIGMGDDPEALLELKLAVGRSA